ncbi:MAG: histidine phosphatase family protein [Acidimicrobiia bacterium]|nr:histidine phosphatase family protein [Acidimicrobiia bacterium]
MAVKIALVRHGRASAGWDTAVDPGLDDLGRAQAKDAAKKLELVFAGQQVQIISSPLLRCQQTAEPLDREFAGAMRLFLHHHCRSP